jgi:hypothetical protein
MKTTTMIAGVSLSLATLAPITLAAQQQPTQATVESELRSLGDRTGEIVRLLKEIVAQNAEDQRLKKLQVAVLALQLRTTVITAVEDRIRTLEDRAAEANERVAQLEIEIERINQRALDDSIKEGPRLRLQNSKKQVESQLEIASQRAWSYERQVLDLQNELTEKRRDVEALEEIVMEGLKNL